MLLAFAIFFIAGNAGAQSVTIDSISGSSFCTGDPISVTFTATGSWGAGNVFLLQLSDSTGSFTNTFQNVGSLFDTLPGIFTIETTIPYGRPSTRYRFRILATSPYVTSTDNGSNIAIWSGPGAFNLYPNLPAGAVGVPVTFTISGAAIKLDGNSQDTAYWDFGLGATPSNATTTNMNSNEGSEYAQQVTYSSPGDKTISVIIGDPGGCSHTLTYSLHIFDCSDPIIPYDAIVVNSDTTVAEGGKTYWVNAGFIFYGAVGDTIFAEAGSTVSGDRLYQCVLYMKPGSVLNSKNGSSNSVIFGEGASIIPESNNYTLNCPTLDFDYSNAPPNPAHPSSSVKSDLASASLTISPNPTRGSVLVQGLPSTNISVSVFNTLGETVMVEKNPKTPDLTLDLSKLAPGTYYVRFASASSVVTKKIVRE